MNAQSGHGEPIDGLGVGLGISLGVAFGAAVGAMMTNVGAGVVIGMTIGLLAGAVWEARRIEQQNAGGQNEESEPEA